MHDADCLHVFNVPRSFLVIHVVQMDVPHSPFHLYC